MTLWEHDLCKRHLLIKIEISFFSVGVIVKIFWQVSNYIEPANNLINFHNIIFI